MERFNTVFAPEGFIDSRRIRMLDDKRVNIIELRMLSDGIAFYPVVSRRSLETTKAGEDE